MIKQYNKWKERRHRSFIKPKLYLLVELLLMAVLCFIVFQCGIVLLNVLVVVGCIYFFITSSWKRYRMVMERQKYYKE
ncbi:MAG: hypothetical protein PHU67_07950 [Sulfurovum sp.]|nr:hypothetical protein [Sulfurovum sp.]MDD3499635.1 hypothetical protein [Sulfurovum sp.]